MGLLKMVFLVNWIKELISKLNLKSKDQETVMPKVGRKHFSYTKSGQKAATKYAKTTGRKVTKRKPTKRA